MRWPSRCAANTGTAAVIPEPQDGAKEGFKPEIEGSLHARAPVALLNRAREVSDHASTRPSRVVGATNVTMVAAGSCFSLAVRADGSVLGWGRIPGYGSDSGLRAGAPTQTKL